VAVAGSAETVERQVRDFGRLLAEGGALETARLGADRHAAAWRALRDVQATLAGPGERVVVKVAVPVARTLELLASAERLARRLSLRAAVTAHAGSGVVRAGYLAEGSALEALRSGLEPIRAQAEGLEGSLVVEAAPPLLRRSLDAWGSSRQPVSIMQRLKLELDPRGVMSPGRFVGGI
jgi:glycolate oxidase FAD binding subunit